MNKQQDFESRTRSLLNESVEDVSPDVARKLQQARYAALEKARPRHSSWFMPRAIAAGVLVAFISAGLWYAMPVDEAADLVAMETELELLSTADNLELMEDLEFMQWLLETQGYAG